MSPLLMYGILLVSVNTFTVDDKYPVRDCDNLPLLIQMQLIKILKTENAFWKILFNFCNLPQILNILKKKMVVIPNAFPKLQSVKDLVRTLSKKRCLGTSFHTQHVKGSQTIVTSVLEHFYHIFSSFWGKMVWKISPLLKFEICGQVSYSGLWEFAVSYSNAIILKTKNFLEFFISFMESTSSLKYF